MQRKEGGGITWRFYELASFHGGFMYFLLFRIFFKKRYNIISILNFYGTSFILGHPKMFETFHLKYWHIMLKILFYIIFTIFGTR